jgi:hypothetical protein
MKTNLLLFALMLVSLLRADTIVYIHIGHSNAAGYCAGPINYVIDSSVMMFSNGKFHRNFSNERNAIPPFLNKMALLYPGNTFVSANVTKMGAALYSYCPGGDMYAKLISTVTDLRKTGAVIGGVIANVGFFEAGHPEWYDSVGKWFLQVMYAVRTVANNPFLPYVYSQYEMNSNSSLYPQNFKYKDSLYNIISRLPNIDRYVALTPFKPINRIYFCDDHHYNHLGYKIRGEDDASAIQINHFDFWYKEIK